MISLSETMREKKSDLMLFSMLFFFYSSRGFAAVLISENSVLEKHIDRLNILRGRELYLSIHRLSEMRKCSKIFRTVQKQKLTNKVQG